MRYRRPMWMRSMAIGITVAFALPAAAVSTDFVLMDVKIGDAEVGGLLNSGDDFGLGVAGLGDLDGNGVDDVAIGARSDDISTGANRGSVYVLFLDEQGAVLDYTVFNTSPSGDPNGAFGGTLTNNFGNSIAWLGDYDGDGNFEIAVGEHLVNAPAVDSGRIWLVDIDAGGVPQSAFAVDGASTNFTALPVESYFGYQIENLGDWDGDGAPEIAVSAIFDDDGGNQNGAVYILYLDPLSTATAIRGFLKISDTQGGFDGGFDPPTGFGSGLAAIGDLDGDGQDDLAIGAYLRGDDGSVYILRMDPGCASGWASCSVLPGSVEITEGSGGLQSALENGDRFGRGLAWLKDTSGYAPDRLLVGNNLTDIGGTDTGSVWLLTLASSGMVTSEIQIAPGRETDAAIGANDRFGIAVASLGDFNKDGITDFVAGSFRDAGIGSAYLMAIDPCPQLLTNTRVYHSPNDDGTDTCFPVQLGTETYPTLHLYVDSGNLVTANPGDVCADGLGEGDEICAIQLRLALEGYQATGFTPAVSGARTNAAAFPASDFKLAWLPSAPAIGPIKLGDLALTKTADDGSVRVEAGSSAVDAELLLEQIAPRAIALPEPGQVAGLASGLCLLGWLVGRRHRTRSGALALLLGLGLWLPGGEAHAAVSIKNFVFRGVAWNPFPITTSHLGAALANAGDIDGDGVNDLFAGAPRYIGNCQTGEAFVLYFLDRDGSLTGYEGPIENGSTDLGHSLVTVGDLNGDGTNDVVAGRPGCVGSTGGAPIDPEGDILVYFFDGNGQVKSTLEIGNGLGGFGGTLDPTDRFGSGLGLLGDIDGDGNVEIAVGAFGDNDGGAYAGAVWILSLDSDGTVAWEQKINETNGGFAGALDPGEYFGARAVGIGDLDGNGVADLAVSATHHGKSGEYGSVFILFLDSTGPGNVSVIGQQEISAFEGGFSTSPGYLENPSGANRHLGTGLAWQPIPDGGGRGVLYVGSFVGSLDSDNQNTPLYVLYIDNDGTVITSYVITETNGKGFAPVQPNDYKGLGSDIAIMGDLDGDEVVDLAVGAASSNGNAYGGYFLFFMQDSDHDGLDDNLDNCPNVHNPLQEDADGDLVGDLCDNCADVANAANTAPMDCNGDSDTIDPGEAVGEQCDVDDDGEGDACEPVEIQLVTTGTPAAPAWDLSLQCGAFDVTALNAAIVLPSGATSPKTLTLSGASIGAGSGTSGPGLVTPAGVRGDAIYFTALGNGAPDNRLCNALDPPVLLGALSTGAIGGTQLAAAALSAEGVGTPGLGLDLAATAGGAVPLTEIRLANGIPLPVLDLELGPAVDTAAGTRWDVLLANASDEFHRVAFGLIAPLGTTAAGMRFSGCDTPPNGSGERTCTGGGGFGATANASRSWTVGPQASPAGSQLPHTLYVVLEGNRGSQATLDTLNPSNAQQVIVLGSVELDGSPDLEPALTTDGVNDIDDLFSVGKVEPFEEADFDTPSPAQVKLIGAFNPADDVDGDDVQDLADNCPFVPNTQVNRGSFLDATDDSDQLGDACQCGESTDDGAVLDPDDFDEIFDYLAGKITNPIIAAQIEERCSVVGTTACNIRDLIFLKQAIDAGDPSVETRCDAALSPAAP